MKLNVLQNHIKTILVDEMEQCKSKIVHLHRLDDDIYVLQNS